MKRYVTHLGVTGVFLALIAGSTFAQQRGDQGNVQLDEHSQQVAHDWYNKHQDHPPAGLRSQDRLSADEESRLHEGATLDPDMRSKVHSAPKDLARQLPPPPPQHRYVAIGGHIGLIDKNFQVKAVIHLH